jgi:hypothetical protein
VLLLVLERCRGTISFFAPYVDMLPAEYGETATYFRSRHHLNDQGTTHPNDQVTTHLEDWVTTHLNDQVHAHCSGTICETS